MGRNTIWVLTFDRRVPAVCRVNEPLLHPVHTAVAGELRGVSLVLAAAGFKLIGMVKPPVNAAGKVGGRVVSEKIFLAKRKIPRRRARRIGNFGNKPALYRLKAGDRLDLYLRRMNIKVWPP